MNRRTWKALTFAMYVNAILFYSMGADNGPVGCLVIAAICFVLFTVFGAIWYSESQKDQNS